MADEDFSVRLRLNAQSLRKSLGKLDKAMSAAFADDRVKREIAEWGISLVDPYVPYHTGQLSGKAHVAYHARSVQIVWRAIDPRSGFHYAEYQHNGPMEGKIWNRDRTVHPLARSNWTEVLKKEKREEFIQTSREIVKRRAIQLWLS